MTVDGKALAEQSQAVQQDEVSDATRQKILETIQQVDLETEFDEVDRVLESATTRPGPRTSADDPKDYDEAKHMCGLPLSLHNTSMLAPVSFVDPEAHELRGAMKGAVDTYRRMRVTGAKYAFNNSVHTTGVLIDGKAPAIPVEAIDDNHVRVYAGCTFKQLYQALHKMSPRRSLINQPGFEELSVIGTMSAGGHGSGAAFGPIANFVKSVDLQVVDGSGAIKTLRLNHPDKPVPTMPAGDTEPYPDPDGFRAAICGMGCLGAIRSIVMETQPELILDETRHFTSWNKFKGEFAGYLAEMLKPREVGGLHSMHLWVSPVPSKVGTDWDCCRLEYRYVAPGTLPVTKQNDIKLSTAELGVDFALDAANHGLDDTLRFFMEYGLRRTSKIKSTLPIELGTLFGSPNYLPVSAASVAVDGSATATIAKMEKLQKEFLRGKLLSRTLEDIQTNETINKKLYVTSPLGLRWVKKGEGLLSPQRWDVSCMIEMPVNWGTNHMESIVRAYWTWAVDNLEGCPHWGQRHLMDAARAKARYGTAAYQAFARQVQSLDPLGYFDNAFTHRLGFRNPT